jgi:hypothetical protein
MIVKIPSGFGNFSEDKDLAREIRRNQIIPALNKNEYVVLDFSQVKLATQSFIHALIGEVLKLHGEEILDRIEFKNCSSPIKELITMVIDYSLGDFE